MAELGRPLFLSGIRKENKTHPNFPELRLIADLFDTYPLSAIPKCATDTPRIEELTIPKEMKNWKLGLSGLSGLLDPGQEMVNHFTLEITKALQKRPTYRPYVIPDLSKEPWRPFYPAHAKALEGWRTLNSSHKKPPPLDLSFQAWSFYNLRFLLAGDLAGAWAPFGGIAAQLSHLGLLLNMSVVENATIAMTYAKYFREQAAHLARQRTTAVDWPNFLAVEDDVIKRNVLRELGVATHNQKLPPTTNTENKTDQQQTGHGTPWNKGKGRGRENKRFPSNKRRSDWYQPRNWNTGGWPKNRRQWPGADWNGPTRQDKTTNDKQQSEQPEQPAAAQDPPATDKMKKRAPGK